MTARALSICLLGGVLFLTPALAGAVETEAPAPADAKPDARVSPGELAALQPSLLVPGLGSVPFGADHAALKAHRAAVLAERYRARILGTPDVRQRDLLLAEQAKKSEEFAESLVEFRGQRTGYDISILSGEFRHNAQQAMYVVVEDDALAYYLCAEGALWKLILQMPAEGRSFEEQLAEATRAYGKPLRVVTRTVYREGEALELPEEAVWEVGALRFVLQDQSALYRAFVAKWLLTEVEKRAAGGEPGGLEGMGSRYGTGDALREVLGPDDSDVEDIVDKLLER